MGSQICVDASLTLKLVLAEEDSDKAHALWASWVADELDELLMKTTHASDLLSPEAIQAALKTKIVGRVVRFYKVTDSTNEVLKRLAGRGAPEGTLVIADWQTAGKGRLGRQWIAPPGSSLLMSILFRPPLAPHQLTRLSMVSSLGVVEGVQAATGLVLHIKWPNDILVRDQKVAGILAESSFAGDRVDFTIVGIGLNVNFDPAGIAGIPPTATSLSIALGRHVPRLPLLASILSAIDTRYARLLAGESPLADWAARLSTIGQAVQVATPHGIEAGVAEGVNPDGALLLRRDDGSLIQIAAGEVSLRVP